jgi:hypothetical protein
MLGRITNEVRYQESSQEGSGQEEGREEEVVVCARGYPQPQAITEGPGYVQGLLILGTPSASLTCFRCGEALLLLVKASSSLSTRDATHQRFRGLVVWRAAGMRA